MLQSKTHMLRICYGRKSFHNSNTYDTLLLNHPIRPSDEYAITDYSLYTTKVSIYAPITHHKECSRYALDCPSSLPSPPPSTREQSIRQVRYRRQPILLAASRTLCFRRNHFLLFLVSRAFCIGTSAGFGAS